jgi:hypothetical protein
MSSRNTIDWTPAVDRLVDLLKEEPRLNVPPGMEKRVAVQLIFAMLPVLTPLVQTGLQEAAARGALSTGRVDGRLADIA